MDITYIPMARGFVYLAAAIDWHSRKVLAWRLSISMDTAFCTEAVEEAIARYGKPEIFNTDQGSQITSSEFTVVYFASLPHPSAEAAGTRRIHFKSPGICSDQRGQLSPRERRPLQGAQVDRTDF